MTWEKKVLDALQDLYDLTANEPVKLVIEGEANDMSGTLFIKDSRGEWGMATCCDGEDDAIDCIIELMYRWHQVSGR